VCSAFEAVCVAWKAAVAAVFAPENAGFPCGHGRDGACHLEVFRPLDVWWAERGEEPSGDDERQCAAVVWTGEYLIEWLEAECHALDVSVGVLFPEPERASPGPACRGTRDVAYIRSASRGR